MERGKRTERKEREERETEGADSYCGWKCEKAAESRRGKLRRNR